MRINATLLLIAGLLMVNLSTQSPGASSASKVIKNVGKHLTPFHSGASKAGNDRIRPYPNLLTCWAASQKDPVLAHVNVIKGDGSRLFRATDSGVQSVLDFCTSLGVYNFGYKPPFLTVILAGKPSPYEHQDTDCSVEHLQSEFGHPLRDIYSQKLLNYSPFQGEGRVLLTLGGAHTNTAFRKIAVQYHKKMGFTNRNLFLAQDISYHGGTSPGDAELTGCVRRKGLEDFFTGNVRHTRHLAFADNDENPVIRMVEELGPERVAAVSFEFITGTSGVYIMPKEKVIETVNYLRERGILIHADEVIAGWGRTGQVWAHQHYDVKPDFMSIAKATTAGYGTMSGLLISEKVASIFDDEPLLTGHTYFGNLRDIRVALAVLDHIESQEESVLMQVNGTGAYLAEKIQEQLGDRPYFVEYRHKGLMGALELKYPKSQLPLSAVDQLALRRALLDQGLYLFGRNNHLILMPSFVLTQEDVDVAVVTIRNVLDNTIPRL